MFLKGEPADLLSEYRPCESTAWHYQVSGPHMLKTLLHLLSFHTWIFKCFTLMLSLTCSVFHFRSVGSWSMGAWQMQGSCEFCHASDCTNALPWYRCCITISRMQHLTSAACGCQHFSKLLHFALLAFTLLGQKCVCTIIVLYFNSVMILENVNYSSVSYCR